MGITAGTALPLPTAPSLKIWAAAATPSSAAVRTRRSARIAAQVTDTRASPKLCRSTSAASAPYVPLPQAPPVPRGAVRPEFCSRPSIPCQLCMLYEGRHRTDCHARLLCHVIMLAIYRGLHLFSPCHPTESRLACCCKHLASVSQAPGCGLIRLHQASKAASHGWLHACNLRKI